jgi:phosphate transport system permease protein
MSLSFTSGSRQALAQVPDKSKPRRRAGRRQAPGTTLAAYGEPMLWLTGGALTICTAMIVGLLALVLRQGMGTFWPVPVVQLATIDGRTLMGEVARRESYRLDYSLFFGLSGAVQDEAGKALHPQLRALVLDAVQHRELFDASLISRAELAAFKKLRGTFSHHTGVKTVQEAAEAALQTQFDRSRQEFARRLASAAREAAADSSGLKLYRLWTEYQTAEGDWLQKPPTDLPAALAADQELPFRIWAASVLHTIGQSAYVTMQRRLLRTGNYELTGTHFEWVSEFEVAPQGESIPSGAVVVERLSWGRFYGQPTAFLIDGQRVATSPDAVWREFQKYHGQIRQRWFQRRSLETHDIGRVNRRIEEARLRLKAVGARLGTDSAEYQEEARRVAALDVKAQEEFAAIRESINRLDRENARFQLVLTTAQGQEQPLALADIVRIYQANQLGLAERLGVYFSRWGEFLLDDPREANTEGGVFPAIFGTVTMTLLMSLVVAPFGVLAALYLREYAHHGPITSAVRISVNNLAGVPSIVFGVFGLGFFCYLIGGGQHGIDRLFFSSKLPTPTFGTGGLLWASLTLALLTLPVVIVSTEEALAAVPASQREGSYACGGSKWQTIYRIVLPRALPGILTGMILAMARGAGEVAPLMLVGAVKLAPELPIDSVFPYIHLQRSFMHLGFHIYDLGFQSQNSEAAKPMVCTTTLLLIAVIAVLNLAAIWLRAKLRKRYAAAHF